MTESDGSVGGATAFDNAQATPASIPQPPARPPSALDTASVGRVREMNSTRLTGPEMEQAIEAGDATTLALLLHAGEPACGRLSTGCTPLVREAEECGTAVATIPVAAGTWGYSTEQRRITVQDSLGRVSTTSYDDAGQVIAQIDPMGHATSFLYDNAGNRTSVEDANGKETTWHYETDSNRLLYTEDALNHRVTHSYDDAGRQTGIQDARGYWYSMSYDTAGRLYTETNPLGYVTTHQYDDAGRETVRTDANGHSRTTTYDAAGRPVSIQYHSGDRVTLQYDAVNRQTTVVDWGGTTTFDYSARGELTGKSIPGGLRLTMVYDSVGNRTTLTEPDGYNYTFGYDELNQCIRLRDPNANVITLQYDTAGRRTTLLDSSGLTRAYAYDPAGRLTTQIDYNGATPIGTFVDTYNAAGIRTGRLQDGTAITWVYDDAYRLINQEKSGQRATFSYDDGGNILTKHHEGSNPLTMSYDAANRLTTSILGTTQLTTYTYSNAGEMTEERCDSLGIRATFVYDGEHRCVNEIRATTHSYTYAFDGLRRSAHMAGTANAVSLIWDGTDLLNEYVPGGLSGRYLTLDGEVLSERRGASRYVYGVDPLGSVVHLLDGGLNRAGTYVYWPYGEVLNHTGADTPAQYVGNLGYYTATTNRVYVRARWLRVDLGRWMTEDPIGFDGGDWNLYGYVRRSPSTFVDPNGLQYLRPDECTRFYARGSRACYECVYHYQIGRGATPHKQACQSANAACGTGADCDRGRHFCHDRPPEPTPCDSFKKKWRPSDLCYQYCVHHERGSDTAQEQDCCERYCIGKPAASECAHACELAFQANDIEAWYEYWRRHGGIR